jgi:molybdopterin molybdotransferase
MLEVEEALAEVMTHARRLPAVDRRLTEALGLVLDEDVAADRDSPAFDKALVDGYAVRSADLAACPARLRVVDEIMAGNTPRCAVGPGEAAVIMTGAPLPHGADTVVMVERTRRVDDVVLIDDPGSTPGRNWLPRGREVRSGDLVLRAGAVLNPVRVGLLASVGKTLIRAFPRPTVAVLSTGDELVEPGQVPGPGQVRNSNAVSLGALVTSLGCEAVVFPAVRDEPEALRRAVAEGLRHDVLLTSGGVSAGQRDLVPGVLDSLGVSKVFHKVRVKPGKPLWFGVGPVREGETPGSLVFGLPGNPVSGVVSFLLFVRPALRALAGQPNKVEQYPRVRLARSVVHSGDRPSYLPARLIESAGQDGIGAAEVLDSAGSGDLRTVAAADGFAAFLAGDYRLDQGEIVRFLPLV